MLGEEENHGVGFWFGFFGAGGVFFCLYFLQSQGTEVKTSHASVQQCHSKLLSAQVACCLGTLMKYSGLPLGCPKCPWNHQVRRKGVVQEEAYNRQTAQPSKSSQKSWSLLFLHPWSSKTTSHPPKQPGMEFTDISSLLALPLQTSIKLPPTHIFKALSSLLPYEHSQEQSFCCSWITILFSLFVWWRGLYYLLNGIAAFPLKTLF